MTLDQGKVGQVYTVTRVGGQGRPDGGCWTLAFCRERWWRSSRAAPLGDPVELRLRGYTLTLRRADSAQVTVEPGPAAPAGGGEGLDMVTIALAGNPNAGKTTLFNALTGDNQFVGNWARGDGGAAGGRLAGRTRPSGLWTCLGCTPSLPTPRRRW